MTHTPERSRTLSNTTPKITVETFASLLETPEYREGLFELIDGEIVQKMPTLEHGVIVLRVGGRLSQFVEDNDLGYVGTEVQNRVPGSTVDMPQPDVSFFAGLTGAPQSKGIMERLPDLVIEVKSSTDTYRMLHDKAEFYLAHGAKMVWLVFPEKHLVHVHTADAIDILTEGDSIDGGALLPGFTLALTTIFKLGG